MTTIHRSRNLLGLAAVALALATACVSPEGSRQAAASDEGLTIAFEKYTLDNGLDVILHEDPSDPIVAMAILVHVGSSREKPGRTGFAHFFEHMSFNDSENVPRGANRKMIGEWGGTRNGGTWTDGTIYYEVVPKDALEKLMWIDSDRMGYMINTVTEWALENEKQVVKNEKRQRVDNRPYGHTQTVILENLYPPDHPYHWPVIGSLADLQAATLEDVRDFYGRYYGPNNASLVIAGDIDRADVKALVERWFGEIPRGPEIPVPAPRPVTLAETKSLYHVDGFARLPELRLTFPTVEQFHADAYALDALAAILADGKRAPLYRVLVEQRQLAPGADASHRAAELAGTFTVRVRANAGVPLDDVKAAIDEALAAFDRDGFSERDLERIKVAQEREFYEGISSVLGKAFQLTQYNTFTGDPGFVTEDLARVKAVTREDVMDVFRRYVKDRPYVMTSFVPRDGESLIVSGATRAEVFEEQIVPGAEETVAADPDFEYSRTATEHVRSEPVLREAPAISLPEIWTAQAAGGMQVFGIERDELPLVELTLRLEGGALLDAAGKSGSASLLAGLLMEGTAGRTPEELEDAIGELGADIDVSADREALTVRASTLARNYEAVMELVREMVLEPRWDAAEFDRLKRARLTNLRQREGNPNAVASLVFWRLLYGTAHPLGAPPDGTVETVEDIRLDDLQGWYRRNVSPSAAAFHVAGAVDEPRVLASLEGFAGWPVRDVTVPDLPLSDPLDRPQVYFIDVPDAKQSVLLVGKVAIAGSDDAYNRLAFANNRLGAGSSARLFQLLRIEKGYTYGARSSIPRTAQPAPFVVSTSVRSNVTLESLELIRGQLRDYAATYGEEDLATTRNLLLKQSTRDFETLGDLLDVLERISACDLGTDFVEREQRENARMTLDDVRATIAEQMDEQRMIYLVVGDARTQLARLRDLGYGAPVQLDVHGRPLPSN